jgi:NAD-dependent dihydropyrimidine dehydrogenase PreA subunit
MKLIFTRRSAGQGLQGLITYEINPDTCIGCTRCARNCPVQAISGKAKGPHVIDASTCIRCGVCKQVCPVGAVHVE